MNDPNILSAQVDAWLQPVADEARPSGRPVSSDVLREFKAALAGKPDTQFSEAVPPDFRKVAALAEKIFARSRDLTVAVGWSRAMLRNEGIAALPQGLRLLQGLVETFKEDLHPQADPDDDSYYARGNAVSVLAETDGLLGDLRQTVLLADRAHGEVRARTVEVALGRLAPRADEKPMTPEQLHHFFAATAGTQSLRDLLSEARSRTMALSAAMAEQVDAAEAPNLTPLVALLSTCLSVIPEPAAAPQTDTPSALDDTETSTDTSRTPDGSTHRRPATAGQAMTGSIQSRADVVRAIDMVCAYLERAEPSNPAQLLLRRAKHLLDQNFLQLIHVLAPTALEEVARLMGVDPTTLTSPPDNS